MKVTAKARARGLGFGFGFGLGCGLGFGLGLGLPVARVFWQGGSKEVEACTVAGRSGESIVREDWRDRTGGSFEGRHAASKAALPAGWAVERVRLREGRAPALPQHAGGAELILDVFLQPRLTDQPEEGIDAAVAAAKPGLPLLSPVTTP